MNKARFVTHLQMLLACLYAFTAIAQATATGATPGARPTDRAPHTALTQLAAHLPLSFQPNKGQTNPDVKFLTRGKNYTVFLTPNEAVLKLVRRTPDPLAGKNGASRNTQIVQGVVRLQWLGANPSANIAGKDEQTGKINYYFGKDPKRWLEHLSTYRAVHYSNLYPGIDLQLYGHDGQLEYDFVVAPGAEPDLIRLKIANAEQLDIDATGDLVIQLGGSEVISHRPVVYQERAGKRKPIVGNYVLHDNNELAFELGAYDHTLPLVIDPVLSYSTFWGGALAHEAGNAIAVDDNGNILIAGVTASTDFPVSNAAQPSCGPSPTLQTTGCLDAFVTKLNPAGNTVIYSTFLGGGETTFVSNNGTDIAHGIATDSAGNAYVTGETNSFNFPATAGAFQTSCRTHPFQEGSDPGGNCLPDAFVAKLNASGSLVYATYLGGANTDIGYAIGVNANGNAYVTGRTFSADDTGTAGVDESFPTVVAWSPTCVGGQAFPPYEQSCYDAFYTKLSADGSFLVQSSYLGGSGNDEGQGIAVRSFGDVWITGHTTSDDFPTRTGMFKEDCGGPSAVASPCDDGFVTKVDEVDGVVGCSPVAGDNCRGNFVATGYATYLGGVGIAGQDIVADDAGNAYVVGEGGTIVTTAGAYDTSHDLGSDAFISKLNATGTGLVFSTYLGGRGNDRGKGIALDASNGVYVTGITEGRFDFTSGKLENDFPSVGEFQPDCGRDAAGNCTPDGFVSQLSPDGASLLFSSYLGGSNIDEGLGIAFSGGAYVTGRTFSADFPAVNPIQPNLLGSVDAFIAKVERGVDVLVAKTAFTDTVTVGETFSYTLRVTNIGTDDATAVTLIDPLPPEVDYQSMSTNYIIQSTIDGCSYNSVDHEVSCLFLSVPKDPSEWFVWIDVVPNTGGEISNTATVEPFLFDEDTGNNSDTDVVTALVPNTPVGTNVLVEPAPGVSVTFSEVTEAGDTTVTSSTEDPGPPGSTLQFLGTYYDITTTATYSGDVELCLTYDDTGMTFGQELALRLYHLENGNWIDRTSALDTGNNVICATVVSLSWFGVAELGDSDSDGLTDDIDNCIVYPNGPTLPDAGGNVQLDTDGDGIGNVCDCDFNQDNFCGGPDFTVFIGCFNAPTGGNPDCESADMNGDGFVGGPDFTMFIGGFNGAPGPSCCAQ
jgi:uncharacterized repeat protein (TIGR01451 family)